MKKRLKFMLFVNYTNFHTFLKKNIPLSQISYGKIQAQRVFIYLYF